MSTGFTIWDGPANTSLPPALVQRLEAGLAPVLVTFGSSAASNGRELFDTIAEVLDRRAMRAVFLVGGSNKITPELAARDDVWSFAPITRVLPRCAAVVHAGGHGTTAAALAAGVPSVVVPMIYDQRWHARRAAQTGVGHYVPRGRGFADRLDGAVATVVGGSAAREVANTMRERISSEDGPGRAADEIEHVLGEHVTGE